MVAHRNLPRTIAHRRAKLAVTRSLARARRTKFSNSPKYQSQKQDAACIWNNLDINEANDDLVNIISSASSKIPSQSKNSVPKKRGRKKKDLAKYESTDSRKQQNLKIKQEENDSNEEEKPASKSRKGYVERKLGNNDESNRFFAGRPSFTCDRCEMQFSFYIQLKSHKVNCSMNDSCNKAQKSSCVQLVYKCNSCQKPLESFLDYLRHLSDGNGRCIDPAKIRLAAWDACVCVLCGFSTRRSMMMDHLRQEHRKELRYANADLHKCCYLCKMSSSNAFASSLEFINHLCAWHPAAVSLLPSDDDEAQMMDSTSLNSITCRICGQVVGKDDFDEHVLSEHCNENDTPPVGRQNSFTMAKEKDIHVNTTVRKRRRMRSPVVLPLTVSPIDEATNTSSRSAALLEMVETEVPTLDISSLESQVDKITEYVNRVTLTLTNREVFNSLSAYSSDEGVQHRCNKCGATFFSPDVYSQHLLIFHPKNAYMPLRMTELLTAMHYAYQTGTPLDLSNLRKTNIVQQKHPRGGAVFRNSLQLSPMQRKHQINARSISSVFQKLAPKIGSPLKLLSNVKQEQMTTILGEFSEQSGLKGAHFDSQTFFDGNSTMNIDSNLLPLSQQAPTTTYSKLLMPKRKSSVPPVVLNTYSLANPDVKKPVSFSAARMATTFSPNPEGYKIRKHFKASPLLNQIRLGTVQQQNMGGTFVRLPFNEGSQIVPRPRFVIQSGKSTPVKLAPKLVQISSATDYSPSTITTSTSNRMFMTTTSFPNLQQQVSSKSGGLPPKFLQSSMAPPVLTKMSPTVNRGLLPRSQITAAVASQAIAIGSSRPQIQIGVRLPGPTPSTTAPSNVKQDIVGNFLQQNRNVIRYGGKTVILHNHQQSVTSLLSESSGTLVRQTAPNAPDATSTASMLMPNNLILNNSSSASKVFISSNFVKH